MFTAADLQAQFSAMLRMNVLKIIKQKSKPFSEAIPAFLCIVAMPLAYSISEGITIGVISWTLINLLTGKAKEKKISIVMYILTVLFILKYIIL